MRPPEFDLLKSPLDGKNLIEASAGTGKTFAITRLYLRLLLEKRLDVDQILVVTFTEAATHELKERIRGMLAVAHEDFGRGKSQNDFLQDYLKNFPDHDDASDLIGQAIRNFDQAAIFTIHGFCNKVLQENAFESDSLFDTQLVTEQNELLRQITQDWWRQHLYDQPPLFISYALDKISLDSLCELIANKVGLLYLDIIPDVKSNDCTKEQHKFTDSFHEVRDQWVLSKEAVGRVLHESPALHRGRYRKTQMAGLLTAMDGYAAGQKVDLVLFKGFDKFTSTSLRKGTKNGGLTPKHRFFDTCDRHLENHTALVSGYSQRLIHLKLQLFEYAKRELINRKQEKNIFFFDDLLLNLHAALNGREALTTVVRNKYKAALIDEFQDTDPVQYEIFDKIFTTGEHTLFLIGDPKQAIYGFRGADIFAYIRAKKEIPRQFTLSKNYRSTPGLVAAINTIFEHPDKPFVYEEIPYHQTSVPQKKAAEELKIEGETAAPFRIWYVDSTEHHPNGKPLDKKSAREIITRAVASEIARLLRLGRENKALLAGSAVEEKDMAVLVRTNLEARQIQSALSELNVHSVLYSSANLFDSAEAEDLERILAAIIEPGKERVLKVALATEMMGVRGSELLEFADNDAAVEVWYEKFLTYHQLWQRHGFARMLKEFTQMEKVLPRLMTYADGERRITNLLHLSEVLNEIANTQKLGRTGLLKWLSEARSATMSPIEEHQLRLESDEKAVKLVTMHKSKGLEYPIVFCPFTWSGSELRRKNHLSFHATSDQNKLTLDLGSDSFERHKVLAEKEELAENLRLLYVAVTRAKHRCYLVWGRFKEGPSSALAYLFHQPGMLAIEDIVTNLKSYVKEFDDDALKKDLSKIASASEAIEIESLPAADERPLARNFAKEQPLGCREFSGKIAVGERISSYSSLVTLHPHSGELADHDSFNLQTRDNDFSENMRPKHDHSNFITFPAGAKTGNFLHGILQKLDFSDVCSARVTEEVRVRLTQFGFEEDWASAVCDMFQKVVRAPLAPGETPFSLSEIARKDRLNELEFYFPIKKVSTRTLSKIFSGPNGTQFGPDFHSRMEELSFAPLKGFMKGFIDLVFHRDGRFYIVDWKSNYLGPRNDHYHQKALLGAMVDNFYILQYHIYVLALHQYLKSRLRNYDYEKHFGGVFYIFVRGVDPSQGETFGIFQDTPSINLVNELTKALVAKE